MVETPITDVTSVVKDAQDVASVLIDGETATDCDTAPVHGKDRMEHKIVGPHLLVVHLRKLQ